MIPKKLDAKKADRKARMFILASHLYYDLGVSIMSDSEFDFLGREVAYNWSVLSSARKFTLGGDPTSLVYTGCCVKITLWVVEAAKSWAAENKINLEKHYVFAPNSFSKKFNLPYCGIIG